MQGDSLALQVIWERHRRWVAAILLAHKPSFEELDDLLQEVAATFVAKIHTVRSAASLRSWLRIVAINAARAAGRSGRYRPRADSGAVDRRIEDGAIGGAEGAGPWDTGDPGERERVTRMLALLAELPEEYREPLILRTVRGLRSRQVSAILGITPASVDTRVARARAMLRRARAAAEEGAEGPVGSIGPAAPENRDDVEPR